ncbi:hypothetical protein HN803_07175 [candidate division WWE3 bacterium]|nr:hypothetical protein [candidate division WWE3 bacterium]
MNRYRQEDLNEMAYRNWEEEARDQVKFIRGFITNGCVKFEDVEEVGYEIKAFLRMSECWDYDGDMIYDFTVEAKQMLDEVTFSFV